MPNYLNKNSNNQKINNLKKYPGFLQFFSDTIDTKFFELEKKTELKMTLNKDLGYNEIDNIPVFFNITKRPKTYAGTTGGYRRPGGYNRNNKYVPPKTIPLKQGDMRVGDKKQKIRW